jgi:hypothetical protein
MSSKWVIAGVIALIIYLLYHSKSVAKVSSSSSLDLLNYQGITVLPLQTTQDLFGTTDLSALMPDYLGWSTSWINPETTTVLP